MQVILLERIEKLGQMGEVVSVKPGYARNYLLPQGKARRATKENFALFYDRQLGGGSGFGSPLFFALLHCAIRVVNRRRCESGYPRCNFYPRHVKQSLAPNLC